MGTKISFIYANRNRNVERIRLSLNSLNEQVDKDLEVVLVDYGSSPEFIKEYKTLERSFDFLQICFLPVSQLLWNKSKALNYGILQARGSFIFIADVDLIFHPKTTSLLQKIKKPEHFQLFRMGYLGKQESEKLKVSYEFGELSPYRSGSVNGMVLSSKEALLKINGFDEFFHFYGAEDEDLFSRLEQAGVKRILIEKEYFFHHFHTSFAGSEDRLMTETPRVKNIMRINQRHFHRNQESKQIIPRDQKEMGKIIPSEKSQLLENPTKVFQVKNILAHVEHFLGEELSSFQNEIIKTEFIEDPYYLTLKHKVKKLLGKQTQPYCSMKEVNDMLLKEILFKYRHCNYSFKIAQDLKSIIFIIQL